MSKAIEWLSRTLAVVVLMVGPCLGGAYLDKQLGTSFLALTGLGVGMILGTTGLFILVSKFAPKARGEPLTDEDWDLDGDEEKDSHGGDDNRR